MNYEPAQLVIAAAHEAGHGIVAAALGYGNVRIVIDDFCGKTSVPFIRNPSEDELARYLVFLVSGEVGEAMLVDANDLANCVRERRNEWGSDGRQIDETLNRLRVDPKEMDEMIKATEQVATEILAENYTAFVALRDELLVGRIVDSSSPALRTVKRFTYREEIAN